MRKSTNRSGTIENKVPATNENNHPKISRNLPVTVSDKALGTTMVRPALHSKNSTTTWDAFVSELEFE